MKDFLRHINLKNQQFKCYECQDKNKTLNLIVDIHNELNEGATKNEISLLKQLIPVYNEEIIEFYQLYNGIKLYCNEQTSGIEFYPINNLKKLNEEWKEWFSEYEKDDMYDFQIGGLAFGDISDSGNYFIFFEGKVFYSDHDGGDDAPVGETFYKFLSKISSEPADFLYKMGCYTRYSDIKNAGQYIPKEFTANEN